MRLNAQATNFRIQPTRHHFHAAPHSHQASHLEGFSVDGAAHHLNALDHIGKGWQGFLGGQYTAPQPVKPFFEGFLEDQRAFVPSASPERGQTQAYPSDSDHDGIQPSPFPLSQTNAYPSDSDHDGIKPSPSPMMQTQAYPSDSDHDGIQPSPFPLSQTNAYPSDSDHDGIQPSPPPIMQTQAYPSDSDHDGIQPSPPPMMQTQAYPSDSDHDY